MPQKSSLFLVRPTPRGKLRQTRWRIYAGMSFSSEGMSLSLVPPRVVTNVCPTISFYPIFPVPFDLAHELSLDASHSNLLYLIPQDDDSEEGSDAGKDPHKTRCAPDVLIVPSRLKHFSKVRAPHCGMDPWTFMVWVET